MNVADIIGRYRSRNARIGVIGLGYVGLPLAAAALDAGFEVVGYDIDPRRIDSLGKGVSPIAAVPDAKLQAALRSGAFTLTAEPANMAEADAFIICVPTPITPQREPDLSSVVAAAEMLVPLLRKGHLVVLESTTWPGTTEEIIRPILERSGLNAGPDFLLAYSPEREDPGNARFATAAIPKIVGGDGDDALRVATALYEAIVIRVVAVSSTQTAEAVKLTENIFRAVNIALVNELKVVFHEMGIDIWEVIEAAKSKPFGYMPFYPGPGLGGHCIPVDPFYLTWKAREYDLTTRFIELAGQMNAAMPRYVLQRLIEELSDRFSKGLRGARLLLVGVAYKKDVADVRESPAFKLLALLLERGAAVDYYDPLVPNIAKEHGCPLQASSIDLSRDALKHYDAVIIVTDHSGVDYDLIAEGSKFILDTRNVMNHAAKVGNLARA